jgi:hypothetical protein
MPSPDPLAALSRGHLIDPWLPRRGRVLNSYRSAVNLAMGDTLWSIVPEGIPDGPAAARVPAARWSDMVGCAAGTPAVLRGGSLAVGAAIVDLRAAARWHPAPFPAPGPGVGQRSEVLAAAALAAGAADWIPEAVTAALSGSHRSAAVRGILGRGIGLTPAGDDALMGALAVLHALTDNGARVRIPAVRHPDRLTPTALDVPSIMDAPRRFDEPLPSDPPTRFNTPSPLEAPSRFDTPSPLEAPSPLRAAVGDILGNLGRTNDLSAGLLALAAAGHFHQPLHDAVCAALSGTDTDTAWRRLFAVGATSGADSALGAAATLHLLLRLQPLQTHPHSSTHPNDSKAAA